MSRFRMLPLLFLINGLTGYSETPPKPPGSLQTLTVSGHGEIQVEPDQAVVQLGVSQEATTAREAQEKVNSTINNILEALADLDIARQQIQTSQLNLEPVYGESRGRGQTNERRVTGYRATYFLAVKTEELELISDVIDSALEAGANQMRGIRFGLKDEAGSQQEALRLAVANATAKAETLASASSTDIVRVLEIVEGSAGVLPAPMVRAGVMAAETMASPTAIMGGEMAVSSHVTIRYEIQKGD